MSTQKPSLKRASQKTNLILPKVDWKQYGPGWVVGVDEVGRGCLAGPVYAAAVALKSDVGISELTDSKLLSEKRREEISLMIWEEHAVGIGCATVEEIDQVNILQASFLAMKRAISELAQKLGEAPLAHVLVDGHMKIPLLTIPQTPLIKGDLRCAPISAASIVAKVARDQLMKEIAKDHPNYGFDSHKGYASPTHKQAIREFGPIFCHRKTFAGVKEHL